MRAPLRIAAVAGGVALLAVFAVAIAVWTVDPRQFVGPVLARVKAATGRDVAIGGGVAINFGWEPTLVVDDLRIRNPPWAHAPEMLSAKRVEARLALFPLLRRHFELVRLHLVEPVISLETNDRGDGSWERSSVPGAAKAPAGGSGAGAPAIDDLLITKGRLTFRDGATGAQTEVAIDTLSLRAPDAHAPIAAGFRGRIDGIAVALAGDLGPLAALADRNLPYPVAMRGEVEGRAASFAAKIRRADGLVELQDLAVTSGASDVKGRVEIRGNGRESTWTVDLASSSLAVADLPLAQRAVQGSQRPTGAGGTPRATMFTTDPLPFDTLRNNDATGNVRIDRLVLADGRHLEQFRARFTLRDGRLDAPAVQAALFGGTLAGALKVDATRGRPPAIALRIDGHGLDLGTVLAATGVKREVRGGRIEVAIDVTMHGSSPREWMNGVSGQARAVVGPATLVNTKLDPGLSFDRLAELVNPFRGTSASTELRCAVIRLPLANGVAAVDRTIALETAQIDVSASGTIDFRNETVDLSFRPRVRQGIPIDIPQIAELVRYQGPFSAPKVVVDSVASLGAIARIGAAIGTGGLSAVGASLLAKASAGGSACDVALGRTPEAARTGASSADAAAAKRGSPPAAEDLGSAIGRLFKP